MTAKKPPVNKQMRARATKSHRIKVAQIRSRRYG